MSSYATGLRSYETLDIDNNDQRLIDEKENRDESFKKHLRDRIGENGFSLLVLITGIFSLLIVVLISFLAFYIPVLSARCKLSAENTKKSRNIILRTQ